MTYVNKRAEAEAKIAPYINRHNARAWNFSTEKYLFVIQLLDDADVSNGHWRWLENNLAALWNEMQST